VRRKAFVFSIESSRAAALGSDRSLADVRAIEAIDT
jgi:hypothetical protein